MSSLRLALGAALFLALTPALAEAPKPKAQGAPAVTVVRAAERELVERAIVTGTLVPREEILVAPEVEGFRIAEVLVEEGSVVRQGEVLARLSRDVLETLLAQNAATRTRAEAAIAQARSNIVQAEAAQVEAAQALERARALMRSGNTTEAVMESRVSVARAAEGRLSAARDGLRIAEAEKASAQAQQREIEWRLSRTEIRAPAAGVVSRKMARVGATATAAGEAMFRIIRDGEIELEGEVTEVQMPRLREGAEAEVTVDGQRYITGRIRNIFPEVDRATRLGKVRIALPKDEGLRIGSFARGTVVVARHTGVAVPTASVLYGTEGPIVLAVVDDKVQARRVATGLNAEGFVEVMQGLKSGEAVVARAGSFLRDGDVVRPVAPDAPKDALKNRTASTGETR
ncbi:MAG TPA: efflux RND transporter periplasmic adaptor subunit [Beijerinckiaceae bacterium]|jgi:RND family efflux transporter MFP subunit